MVLNSQKEDGSWGGNGGHGDLAGDAPIYVTSLCTLMMEVYYRYLPATDNKKGGQQSGLMDRK